MMLFLYIVFGSMPVPMKPAPVHSEAWVKAMEAKVTDTVPNDALPRIGLTTLLTTKVTEDGPGCIHAKEVGHAIDAFVIMDENNITTPMFSATYRECDHSLYALIDHRSTHCPGRLERHSMHTCIAVTYNTPLGHKEVIRYENNLETFCVQHMLLVSNGYIVECASLGMAYTKWKKQ